jgi:LPXTG-motif cell wall-anchored protein
VGLGGMLAGAVIVGLVLGLLADRATGESPTWTLVGIGLGILAAVVGFWAKVRSVLK